MSIIKVFISKIISIFHKSRLGSRDEVHWINHICDETVSVGGNWGTAQWANLHGFDEGPGVTYYVGLDCRCWGIRIADYVIKCKTRAMYDKYIGIAKRKDASDFLHTALNDSALWLRRGGDVGIKFIFKWCDTEKTFNVRLAGDFYAEEK